MRPQHMLLDRGVCTKPGDPVSVLKWSRLMLMFKQKPLTLLISTALCGYFSPTLSAADDPNWHCTAVDGEWQCNEAETPSANESSNPPTLTPLTAEKSAAQLDWYGNAPGGSCQGSYLEPSFNDLNNTSSYLAESLYIEAGQSSTDLGKISKLKDSVTLQQGDRQLSAASAELDQQTQKAYLYQNVSYREPGLLLTGSQASFDIRDQSSAIDNASFVLHGQHLRGSAERIFREASGDIVLTEGSYTYCPPNNSDWQLNADSISLDRKQGVGIAKHAVLRVKDVPVFYLPYVSFPIDDQRRSGLLYPSFSYDQTNGVEWTQPYYFNLAENYDDTLTTRWIGERGLLLENEFRYLGDWSENQLSTAYIGNDRLTDDSRWLASLQHKGEPAKHWQSNINFTAVSDDDYFSDLSTDLEISRASHLDKLAELSHSAEHWYMLMRLHSYQTIDGSASPYRRLPQVLLYGNPDLPISGVRYQAEAVHFSRDTEGLTGADRVTGQRLHFMPTIEKSLYRPWGSLKTEASWWSSAYQLDDQVNGFDNSPSVNTPILSLDGQLFMERSRAGGGTQTLEPRLFALYVPDRDQQEAPIFDSTLMDFDYRYLFRHNRFSGRDRIGDAQQLTFGVSSRLFEEDGSEQASISIAQAWYFDDRDVTLPGDSIDQSDRSDIALEASWQMNPMLQLGLDNIFDKSSFSSNITNLHLRYEQDLDHRVNFSYRFEEGLRQQADLSMIWPLGPQWTALARWQRDMESDKNLETIIGIEYDSCCWAIQLASRNWLTDADQHNSGFYLRFRLKGLGTVNSKNTDFLNDISGFKERNERNDF